MKFVFLIALLGATSAVRRYKSSPFGGHHSHHGFHHGHHGFHHAQAPVQSFHHNLHQTPSPLPPAPPPPPVEIVHHVPQSSPTSYHHSSSNSEDDHHFDYFSPPHYNYEYSVHDGHTGDVKTAHESRDGDVVKGFYSVKEADGTTREVHYTADKHNGFTAEVKRTGHAEHPVHTVQHPVVHPAVHAAKSHIVYHHGSEDHHTAHAHSSIFNHKKH